MKESNHKSEGLFVTIVESVLVFFRSDSIDQMKNHQLVFLLLIFDI